MTPQLEHKTRFLNFDPRTKIILIGFCALTATTIPSLQYECILITFIAVYGVLSGKIRYTIIGTVFYFILYGLTMQVLKDGAGTANTIFIAWLSLFFKVYPCGLLSGIVISTTRVNEFLSAMNKAHIPKKDSYSLCSYASLFSDCSGRLALHKGCNAAKRCIAII